MNEKTLYHVSFSLVNLICASWGFPQYHCMIKKTQGLFLNVFLMYKERSLTLLDTSSCNVFVNKEILETKTTVKNVNSIEG